MNQSRIRCAGAGCLLAVGLMLGGSAGLALADSGNNHPGDDGGRTHRGGRFTRDATNGPHSTVGDGREGLVHKQGVHSGSDGSDRAQDAGAGAWTKSGRGDSVFDGPRADANPVDPDAVNAKHFTTGGGWFYVPKNWPFPFPIPALGIFTGENNPGGGFNPTNYFQAWQQTFEQFAQVIVPAPPAPKPQIRAQIVEQEPVLDTTPGRNDSDQSEPANIPEPPILHTPLVVPLGAPAAPQVVPPEPAVPPTVALPPGTKLPWIPPSALAEPPPGTPPPRIGNAVPPAREPLPGVGASMNSQASYRVGYSEYLRNARVPELVELALPGVGGMLLLTASGGFIGYRQAKAGHSVRTRSIDHFLG